MLFGKRARMANFAGVVARAELEGFTRRIINVMSHGYFLGGRRCGGCRPFPGPHPAPAVAAAPSVTGALRALEAASPKTYERGGGRVQVSPSSFTYLPTTYSYTHTHTPSLSLSLRLRRRLVRISVYAWAYHSIHTCIHVYYHIRMHTPSVSLASPPTSPSIRRTSARVYNYYYYYRYYFAKLI